MKALRPSCFRRANNWLMRVSAISSGVQLREILPIDVDVLIAASGEVHDEDFVGRARSEAHGFGDGMRGLERRNETLFTREPAGGFERLAVVNRSVFGPSYFTEQRVLRSDGGVIEAGRDR